MKEKKNLIYIFADQWRADAVGYSGIDPVHTPNIDLFSKEAMQFSNAISTYPLCSPHRASLMTGKYPVSCGFWTNCKPGLDEVIMLKPQEICISDVLSQNGYHTGYIGKWHLDGSELNFSAHPSSTAQGWDAYTPPGERRHSFDFWHSYGAMDNHTSPHYWEDNNTKIFPNKYSLEHETDVALDFIKKEAQKEAPFALFLSWNPPHPPYDLIPSRYLESYADLIPQFKKNVPETMRENQELIENMGKYFAAVGALDEQFGRILSYLKGHSLWDDTILVLSSDHGDMLGSHGLYGKNTWYEESIHIPLLFGGGGIGPGHCDCLLSSQDHMPTLLDLLSLPIPASVEGMSFADAVLGRSLPEEPEYAFLCMMPGMPDMVHEYSKRGLLSKSFGWRGLRSKRCTYIIDNGCVPDEPQRRLLYDNEKDPDQLHPQVLMPGCGEDIHFCRILEEYLQRLGDCFLLERKEKPEPVSI